MVKITHLSKSSTVVWFQISNFYHGTTYCSRGRKKVKIRVKGRRRFDFSTNEVNKDKIFIFLNQKMPIKIENHFLPQLTYKRLHVNISFWPSGSRVASFFLYTLFGTFSCIVLIVQSFFVFGLNASEMPVPMSELHCGSPSWLPPLNFMVEIHLTEPYLLWS